VQVDEIWSFCHSKAKNVSPEHFGLLAYGDVWTWTAIDADTKLVPSWRVGRRDYEDAVAFLGDLASRMANRVQLTTDGLRVYLLTVPDAFAGEVDYAQLIKVYGPDPNMPGTARRYSPRCASASSARPSWATLTRRTSPPATSSGRTSQCGWGCAASQD